MKKLFLAVLVSLSVFVGVGVSTVTAAPIDAAKKQVCTGISGQVGGTCGSGALEVQRIIRVVLNMLSVIVGLAAVIMIIIAGLKYVTSGGDSSAIASAKSTLTYAIVGLVVTALAQMIVFFVLTETK